MLDEKTVWRLTRMVDVCLTNIIPHESRYFNSATFNSFKFSYVVAQERFSGIRELAEDIYAFMTYNEHYCPTVTKHENGIQMLYEEDEGRGITIILHPGEKMQYQLNGQIWMELPKLSILEETLALLCRFLENVIEVA